MFVTSFLHIILLSNVYCNILYSYIAFQYMFFYNAIKDVIIWEWESD